MRRMVKAIVLLVVTAVVVPVATAGTVLASFLFLPLPASVPAPKLQAFEQGSRVFDIDGTFVGEFRKFDTSKPVTQAEIPAILKQAVIASEDKRFYEHGGFDVRGTFRAFWADVRSQQVKEGGSTITQQYVKNAYVGKDRTVTRKIREAVLASQLDRQKDKDEILFLYLDQLYLGEGAYGVGAAAENYFRKSVKDLSVSEAALLAGIIPAPSAYNPRADPFTAEIRRVHVLDLMLEQKLIDQAAYDAAKAQHVFVMLPGKPGPAKGQPVTIVFERPTQRLEHPYFMDYVQRYLKATLGGGTEDVVYTRSLDIYTTMDPRMQKAAEEEVATTLNGTPDDLEMSLVALEPGSGYVKAIVGGRDFYSSNGQVNIALGRLGGGSGRQPGSTFKPIVLAEALEEGISPNKTFSGANKICVTKGAKPYCPPNYGGASYGQLTLREATKHSVNSVYAQLTRDVGVEKVMARALSLGITAAADYKAHPSNYGLSVGLGALDTWGLDMASAYSVWANRGLRAEPTPVARVLDRKDNTTLIDKVKPETTRVMKEATADTMNDVLQGPLSAGGTAAGKDIGRPAAGKTGTTDENVDASFTGYTPQLSTSIWMGHRSPTLADGKTPNRLRNIKGVAQVTGGTLPAATWQRFMKRAMAGFPVATFNKPAPITEIVSEAKQSARGGFDIGVRRAPIETDDGGARPADLPPPVATAPTTSTTAPTTTTSLPAPTAPLLNRPTTTSSP